MWEDTRSIYPCTPNKTHTCTSYKSCGLVATTFSTDDVSILQERSLLATAILLDRALTLAAFLRVALDPVSSFTIISAFLQPHLRDRTYHRTVIGIYSTPKAECMRAGCTARDNGDNR